MGHHRPSPWGSGWGAGWHDAPWGGRGRPGPPPWVTGLFGLAQGEPATRGPRVRRGDVRAAILDVLRAEPMNGYQVIAQISERSRGAWKPSPGSIYPTISQLEDEGLIEGDQEHGRRKLKLTPDGWEYVSANREELDAVWTPFEEPDEAPRGRGDYSSLKPEIGQVMNAVWQIITTGSEQQKRDAIDILVDTRRRLYGLLAEGEADADGEDDGR
jgi:DNA-binding PadR family transcriptional regulator